MSKMRDLKTLLELLLEEWEKRLFIDNTNMCKGLCILTESLAFLGSINWAEASLLKRKIVSYLEEGKVYLFKINAHNERVEWLKERIKELEK